MTDPRELQQGEFVSAYALSKDGEIEALVDCNRTSSQDTVEAWHRRGLRLVRVE